MMTTAMEAVMAIIEAMVPAIGDGGVESNRM